MGPLKIEMTSGKTHNSEALIELFNKLLGDWQKHYPERSIMDAEHSTCLVPGENSILLTVLIKSVAKW